MPRDKTFVTGILKRHRFVIFLCTLGLLLAGGITVFSIQSMQTDTPQVTASQTNVQRPSDPSSTRSSKYVTKDEKGELIVLDRDTGRTRKLQQDEKKRLAEALKQMINNTSDGLITVQHGDGSISIDLDGHFQNVMLAKKNDDGTTTTVCVNDLESAAAFFEIDPVLLGLAARPVTKRSAEKLEIQ